MFVLTTNVLTINTQKIFVFTRKCSFLRDSFSLSRERVLVFTRQFFVFSRKKITTGGTNRLPYNAYSYNVKIISHQAICGSSCCFYCDFLWVGELESKWLSLNLRVCKSWYMCVRKEIRNFTCQNITEQRHATDFEKVWHTVGLHRNWHICRAIRFEPTTKRRSFGRISSQRA